MKHYIVNAFTDKLFKGNPATICVLDDWLSDSLMLNIQGKIIYQKQLHC